MVGAKALLEGIRQDLATVTEQLLRHPYVQGSGARADWARPALAFCRRAVQHHSE